MTTEIPERMRPSFQSQNKTKQSSYFDHAATVISHDRANSSLNDRFLTAAKNGDFERVQNFLSRASKHTSVNVDAKDKQSGNTAVVYAAMNKDKNMLSLLLNYGADITLCNNYGYSVLDLAPEALRPILLEAWAEKAGKIASEVRFDSPGNTGIPQLTCSQERTPEAYSELSTTAAQHTAPPRAITPEVQVLSTSSQTSASPKKLRKRPSSAKPVLRRNSSCGRRPSAEQTERVSSSDKAPSTSAARTQAVTSSSGRQPRKTGVNAEKPLVKLPILSVLNVQFNYVKAMVSKGKKGKTKGGKSESGIGKSNETKMVKYGKTSGKRKGEKSKDSKEDEILKMISVKQETLYERGNNDSDKHQELDVPAPPMLNSNKMLNSTLHRGIYPGMYLAMNSILKSPRSALSTPREEKPESKDFSGETSMPGPERNSENAKESDEDRLSRPPDDEGTFDVVEGGISGKFIGSYIPRLNLAATDSDSDSDAAEPLLEQEKLLEGRTSEKLVFESMQRLDSNVNQDIRVTNQGLINDSEAERENIEKTPRVLATVEDEADDYIEGLFSDMINASGAHFQETHVQGEETRNSQDELSELFQRVSFFENDETPSDITGPSRNPEVESTKNGYFDSLTGKQASVSQISDTKSDSSEWSELGGFDQDESDSEFASEEGFVRSRIGSSCRKQSLVSQGEDIVWKKGNILGKGAFGQVWLGLTSTGEMIAVKQVELYSGDTKEVEEAEKQYEMLQEEVTLLKTLRHENVVRYIGTCLEGRVVNIFMEFVPGGSIASILARFGSLSESVFQIYTKQLVSGVAYLHRNNVIHRDIKGGNIMIMPTGVLKLIDFNCAKRLYINLSMSRSNILRSMKGSPYWMAPEVIMETGHGRKADIWGIGCTVFEMATGKPPWADMPRMPAIFAIGSGSPVPQLSEEFSEEARHFVSSCMTRDPDVRPSAIELQQHRFIKE